MELSDHESRLKRCHLFIATIGFIGLALTLTSCGGGGNSPSSGTGGTLSIGGPTITSLNPSGGSVNLSASQVTAVGYTIEGRAFYASHNASGVAGVLLADGSTFVPLPLDLQPSVTQYNVTAFVQNGWVAGVCGPRGGGSGNQFAYAFNPTTGQKYVKVGLNAPECVSSEGMLVLATFTNSSSGNKMTGHVLVQLSTGAQSVLPSSTNAYTVLRRNVHGAVLFTEFISGPSVKEIVEKRATLALAPARKKAFGSGG